MSVDWTIVVSTIVAIILFEIIGYVLAGSALGLLALFSWLGQLGGRLMRRVWGIEE